MAENPYASVINMIQLPGKYKVSQHKKLFQPLPELSEDGFELAAPLLIKTNQLVDQINEFFEIYQNAAGYRFIFPESMFPSVPAGERNMITYEQKIINEQENTFKDRLSEEQLMEIGETGEFKVKSNIQYITLPYIWKINQTIFWGKQKVELVWNNSLARIFGFFYSAKEALLTGIPRELNKIKMIPKRLFTLLFGAKQLDVAVSVNYDRQIFKDFWESIMDKYYKDSNEWGSSLWNYLFIYFNPQMNRPIAQRKGDKQYNRKAQLQKQKIRQKYNNESREVEIKKQKILKIHYNFNQEWGKLKKKVINQISEEYTNLNNSTDQKTESQEQLLVNGKLNSNSSDQKILNTLANKKFSLYLQHLQDNLPKENVPVNVINSIVFILRLFRVISLKYANKTKEEGKRRRLVEESIKKKYPIKSLYSPFFTKLVEEEMEKISKGLDNQMYQSLKTDPEFTTFLKEDQLNAYNQYVRFRSGLTAFTAAKKKQLPQLHEPSRVFYSNYRLLPSEYKIIQDENTNYYSMTKVSDYLTVDTATKFWKFRLYWMRVKTWTINCLIFLAFVVLKGPVGLRCLFGKNDFQYDMDVNYLTGQIYYHTRKTVWGTFLTVLDGVTKSRNNFQQQPDLGLLGKNVSRIFNYIECYVFRFFFVGIILTLIGYPCLIVVCSVVSSILVVTFWAWMPLILFVCYLFNIIIYQFESGFIPNRGIIRSIPLLGLIFQFIRSLIVMLLLFLNLTVWIPFKSFFLLLFCLIQKYFRKSLDGLMLFMFRHLGRTPSRDTSIAHKISGPGMSKDYYMSINQDDVYVLIRAQLERIYMQKFNELIQSKIINSTNFFRKTMEKILTPFNSYYNGSNIIYENTNELAQNYRTQYYQYMARYPNNPYRVRFTQEEIDNYFENTVQIVRQFVQKNQIKIWMFDKYQLYEGMYDELTRAIWMGIFGCGEEIFEPLQKIDARFKLEDQYKDQDGFNYSMKKNVGSVMRALQGEVKLTHNNQRLAPFKHNLLNRERSGVEIELVFNLWRQNCKQNVNLTFDNLQTLFVPNLNISQIIISDREKRERQIKSNSKIIDL